MIHHKQYAVTIKLILSLLFLLAMSLVFYGEDLKFKSGAVVTLSSGWSHLSESGERVPLELPARLSADAHQWVDIQGPFPEGETLLLRASLSDVEVSVDGRSIYQAILTKSSPFQAPVASAWHLVDLPTDLQGETLQIRYRSPFASMSGVINPVVMGSRGQLLFFLIEERGLQLFTLLMIFLIALVLLVIPLVFPGEETRELFHLGAFALGVDLWLFGESRMMQFFVGSQYLVGGLSYIVVSLFPIPFFYYVKRFVDPSHHGRLMVMAKLFFLNTVFVVIMDLLGVVEFFDSILLTNFFLIGSMLYVGWILTR